MHKNAQLFYYIQIQILNYYLGSSGLGLCAVRYFEWSFSISII